VVVQVKEIIADADVLVMDVIPLMVSVKKMQ
jgi:hypothetical protein